jgi:hypothetical protein
MKYIFILLLLMSCSDPDNTPIVRDNYNIRTIDDCQYIEVTYAAGFSHGYYSLTHKGNCINPIHKCR